jgi:dihydrofolate reductase
MRSIGVVESVTLDGVMQAPGGEDEDTRGGFEHGGWARPYGDDVLAREMGKGMGRVDLLFGRRTYEQFFSFWPSVPRPNPFSDLLDETPKFVASRTLREPLPWVNSTLLAGEAATTVTRLKAQPGRDLAILGSGELVRALLAHDLVDQVTLLIHPLTLGTGKRLFPDDGRLARFTLTDSVTTTTGVVIATYRPA